MKKYGCFIKNNICIYINEDINKAEAYAMSYINYYGKETDPINIIELNEDGKMEYIETYGVTK